MSTLIDLHVCQGLPLVHGDEPAVLALPAAAEVDHQLALVASQGFQDRFKPCLAEMAVREKEGRYDDLLRLS